MNNLSSNEVTLMGKTVFRGEKKPFGIKQKDRLAHIYIIGKTGTGKSTLLKTMIAQDLVKGQGFALLDPHGDLVEEVVKLVPPHRKSDVFYLNVPDTSKIWHFNPLADVPKEKRSLAVAGLVEVFKKIWADDWGPRLEHLLRNVLFALLEFKGATFAHANRLLTNKDFRQAVARHISNEEVRTFWLKEYEGYSPAFRAVVAAPLQNKLGAFLTDPLLKNILTGGKNSFSLAEIMERGQVLLVNLSKGRIGEGTAEIIGSFLVAHLGLSGMARAELGEDKRFPFFIYLDEFQVFATLSLTTMLSELRKYGVGLILAHQYMAQIPADIWKAAIGNTGTLACFRVGAQDADYLAKELFPRFQPGDLTRMPNYRATFQIHVNGKVVWPFSGETVLS